ncbi:MAG: VCBS repeat-containing protein [Propionicimonas sp.]
MPSRPVLVSLATSLLVAPVLSVMIAPPAQAAPAPAAKPKPAKVASPDYDGDGKADLAAVANGDDERYFVRVWYGSGRVADITYAELKPDSNIGNELLAADLDGDGYTDLIATSWGEKGTGIHVIPGSATGLQPSAQQTVIMSTNEAATVRSLALVESPVRRLAVGISTYRGSGKYADEVRLYRLSAAGRPTGTPIKLQPGSGKLPKLLKNSYFRPMESWGNQLFIGAPEAKVSGKAGAGAVAVVTLDSKGVKSVKVITQATKGVTGAVDKHDGFGWSLAARDGYLVVGTRADHVGAVKDTGSIQVFSLSKGKVKPVRRILAGHRRSSGQGRAL